MKSPEQMGGPPDAPEEDLTKSSEKREGGMTTPEEATEITRQRRKEYGLEEGNNPTPEELQKIEAAIKELLAHLNEYDFDNFNPEVQDEWYWVAQEADVGIDRELAKVVLEEFLNTLKTVEV